MNHKLVGLILMVLFFSCKREKYTIPNPPQEKPGLLLINKGLEAETSKLIFERYYAGQHSVAGYKIFENGAYYKLYHRKSGNIKDDISWEKVKMLNENELQRFTKIYKNYVLEYIKHPTQNPSVKRVSYSHWYFYIDKDCYIKSYTKSAGYSFFNAVKSEKMFNSKPKFAKKIESFLDAIN